MMQIAKPWGPDEIANWWAQQVEVRSYNVDVLTRLDNLPASALVEKYGPGSEEFRLIKVGSWIGSKPKILITGGVHGYETGGVDAALTFVEKHALALAKDFDFVVYPCINPLAYRFNTRWNDQAQDTNRHFSRDPNRTESKKSAPECVAFMDSVDALGVKFALAIDLHETTQRDIELRADKMKRDGKTGAVNLVIPKGFYLAMNKIEEGSPIGAHIIESVGKATKIADEPIILDVDNKGGIVYLDPANYPAMCMNYSQALHRVTTEVYPDIISRDEALAGQIAAIFGALDYIRTSC